MNTQTISTLFAGVMVALALIASACAPEQPTPEPEEQAVSPEAQPERAQIPPAQLDRAREAATALGSELQAALLSALERDGPLGAVEVCAVEAQEISRRHSDEEVVARRTSLLTRNPINDPDPFEAERLQALEDAHARGDLPPEDVELRTEDGERVLRYLRPIVMAEPCLACHGDPGRIDSSVLELIQTEYPEDRAVGYSAGDFRGAVSVRIRLGEALEP